MDPPEIPRLRVSVDLDDGTKIAQPQGKRLKTLTAADVDDAVEEDA